MSGLAVAALLAAHFCLALTAACDKCNTVDELVHVTGGYTYWKLNDYRFNPEGGILGQRLMALPLLLGDFKLPSLEGPTWRDSDLWSFGFAFFYQSGNDPRTILLLARAMMALVSVALGMVVYLWSRKLFGPAGGMLSLALYALCPVFLANAALATMDVLASLCFLLAIAAFWRMLERPGLATLLVSALAFSALLLAKFSAVLVAPMLAMLMVPRLFAQRPLEVSAGRRRLVVRHRVVRLGVLIGALLVHAVVAVAMIWAFYGMRYDAFTTSTGTFYRSVDRITKNPHPGPVGQVCQFADRYRLLPEAYTYGFVNTWVTVQGRYAFMNGRYSMKGWWSYFPYAMSVKTPLPMLALAALAAGAALVRWRRQKAQQGLAIFRGVGGSLLRTWPLWVLLALYLGPAMASHINIGYRHVLPVYAALLVLCGSAADGLGRKTRLAAAAMVLLLAAETAWAWPNYLSYFNQLAGGQANGYKHLVDSSLDWGQDLPALKRRLQKNAPDGTRVYLSYFGSSSPTWYGIDVNRMQGWLNKDLGRRRLLELREGTYCVSATMLQGVMMPMPWPWRDSLEERYQKYSALFQQYAAAPPDRQRAMLEQDSGRTWDKILSEYDDLRYGRLIAYLRHRRPDDQVNGSILIYRLTVKDLHDALVGPPAQLLGG